MSSLIFLIPAALFHGFLGLCLFLWSLESGQYNDLEGAAWRILAPDDAVDSRPFETSSVHLPIEDGGQEYEARK